MDLDPKLVPWWYTPEGQPDETPARFKLKPLTEPQLLEVLETFQNGRPTERTWYRAGEIGIVELDGINISGKPAAWPRDKDYIPIRLVIACGCKLCVEAWGLGDDDGGMEKNSQSQP